jgi:Flavin containing amine oxidoreductase
MYDYLKIQYRQQRFMYEFRRSWQDASYFIHASSLHQIIPPTPRGTGFGQWVSELLYVAFWYFYWTICCLVIPASQSILTTKSKNDNLSEYLDRINVPDYFRMNYLLPLFAVVATCSIEDIGKFPITDIIAYKRKTDYQPHLKVDGGIEQVQSALSAHLTVQYNALVTSISVEANAEGRKIRVAWRSSREWPIQSSNYFIENFDIVVLAVSPDVAHRIYHPLTPQLSQIPIRHVESSIYQSPPSAILIPPPYTSAEKLLIITNGNEVESVHDQCAPGYSMMNRVVGSTSSLAAASQPIHRANFTRIIRTPESRTIVNNIFAAASEKSTPTARPLNAELMPLVNDEKQQRTWRSGDDNIFLVGGWCWDGMVLLEGCIVSAMRVAKQLGVDIPWEKSQKRFG